MTISTRADSRPTHLGDPCARRRKSDIIPSLDGLRAISVIFVMIGHAIKMRPNSFAFNVAFEHAGLGVNVFFIISGFLITSLLLKERSEFGSISLRLFYARRALRILPAFFLFVGTVAILSIFGVVPVPARFWPYVLTWTVNFAPLGVGVWVLGHLWSLSVEEQFYLVWPLLMKSVKRRTWITVAIIAVFASPLTHVFHKVVNLTLPPDAFPYVCGPIAMGCLLAIKSPIVRNRITSLKFFSNRWTLLFVLILVALLDGTLAGTFDGSLFLPAPVVVFIGILTNFLLTFCVARFVFISTGLAAHVLNSAPAIVIGTLSYSLYLWQQLFLNSFGSAPIPTPFPVNSVLIFAAASASYWGLEVRLLKLRKKLRKV